MEKINVENCQFLQRQLLPTELLDAEDKVFPNQPFNNFWNNYRLLLNRNVRNLACEDSDTKAHETALLQPLYSYFLKCLTFETNTLLDNVQWKDMKSLVVNNRFGICANDMELINFVNNRQEICLIAEESCFN